MAEDGEQDFGTNVRDETQRKDEEIELDGLVQVMKYGRKISESILSLELKHKTRSKGSTDSKGLNNHSNSSIDVKPLQIQDKNYILYKYHKCFTGVELVNWIRKNLDLFYYWILNFKEVHKKENRGKKQQQQQQQHGDKYQDHQQIHHHLGETNVKNDLMNSISDSDIVMWVKNVLINRYHYLHCITSGSNNLTANSSDSNVHFGYDNHFYRLQMDENDYILNYKKVNVHETKNSANVVAANMKSTLTTVFGKYLSDDGKHVDYNSLKNSDLFQNTFLPLTFELQRVNLGVLTEIERKAFFINIYNALCLHGITIFGEPSGLLGRGNFYSKVSYRIGDYNFSLNDIEHGILRCNASIPILGLLLGNQFKSSDHRKTLILSKLDARLHFCLNCGAKSCPAIRFYSVENLDKEMTKASRSFCGSEVEVDSAKKEVRLSKLFQWYYNDFGKNDKEVLKFICSFLTQHSNVKKTEMESILEQFDVAPYKLKFEEYNWSSNSI